MCGGKPTCDAGLRRAATGVLAAAAAALAARPDWRPAATLTVRVMAI